MTHPVHPLSAAAGIFGVGLTFLGEVNPEAFGHWVGPLVALAGGLAAVVLGYHNHRAERRIDARERAVSLREQWVRKACEEIRQTRTFRKRYPADAQPPDIMPDT